MKNVIVRVPEKLNLEQCQNLLATILKKAGCPLCYSGLNISFENLVDPAETLLVVEKGTHNILEF